MSTILAPLGPAPEAPDRNRVSSWSMASMNAFLEADDRCGLHAVASRAIDLERRGASHFDVMLALAGAEGRAARIGTEELAMHAARLNAYAEAHSLRGWYRYTNAHGEHRVQVNKIRTAADGNVGRYYVHLIPLMSASEKPYWVVDRDTGRTAARFATNDEALMWITASGGMPQPAHRPTEVLATVGDVL